MKCIKNAARGVKVWKCTCGLNLSLSIESSHRLSPVEVWVVGEGWPRGEALPGFGKMKTIAYLANILSMFTIVLYDDLRDGT